MADTFGTINITVLQEGMGRQQSAEVAIQHIPGGNINYVDQGGRTPTQYNYGVLCTEANYVLLEAQVGGTAALVSSIDGTIPTALLADLTRIRRVPSDGQTFANATFLKVS